MQNFSGWERNREIDDYVLRKQCKNGRMENKVSERVKQRSILSEHKALVRDRNLGVVQNHEGERNQICLGWSTATSFYGCLATWNKRLTTRVYITNVEGIQ